MNKVYYCEARHYLSYLNASRDNFLDVVELEDFYTIIDFLKHCKDKNYKIKIGYNEYFCEYCIEAYREETDTEFKARAETLDKLEKLKATEEFEEYKRLDAKFKALGINLEDD